MNFCIHDKTQFLNVMAKNFRVLFKIYKKYYNFVE